MSENPAPLDGAPVTRQVRKKASPKRKKTVVRFVPPMGEPRGASKSARYRSQFAWAERAVGASSTIAAAWLQKPQAERGAAIMLGLFYFRKPKEGRHKAQVWRVTRSEAAVTIKFLGSAKGHTEAYRTFYQPLRLAVRKAQKDARTRALATATERAHRQAELAADMAARIVVGTPAKNDKRDLAAATR